MLWTWEKRSVYEISPLYTSQPFNNISFSWWISQDWIVSDQKCLSRPSFLNVKDLVGVSECLTHSPGKSLRNLSLQIWLWLSDFTPPHTHVCTHTHTHTDTHTHTHIYIYIYIYIERERERERVTEIYEIFLMLFHLFRRVKTSPWYIIWVCFCCFVHVIYKVYWLVYCLLKNNVSSAVSSGLSQLSIVYQGIGRINLGYDI